MTGNDVIILIDKNGIVKAETLDCRAIFWICSVECVRAFLSCGRRVAMRTSSMVFCLIRSLAFVFGRPATALGISVILDVAGSRRVNTSAAEQPATAIVKQI